MGCINQHFDRCVRNINILWIVLSSLVISASINLGLAPVRDSSHGVSHVTSTTYPRASTSNRECNFFFLYAMINARYLFTERFFVDWSHTHIIAIMGWVFENCIFIIVIAFLPKKKFESRVGWITIITSCRIKSRTFHTTTTTTLEDTGHTSWDTGHTSWNTLCMNYVIVAKCHQKKKKDRAKRHQENI